MLFTLLACVFADPKYDDMAGYPYPENRTNFYQERPGERDIMPWDTFKPILTEFLSMLEGRDIYRGMVVSGYMSRRIKQIKDGINEDTNDAGILDRLIAELKHERNDRKPEGNPDSWTDEDTAVLDAYEKLLEETKQKTEHVQTNPKDDGEKSKFSCSVQ